jgi:hypothetical protein
MKVVGNFADIRYGRPRWFKVLMDSAGVHCMHFTEAS